MPIPLNMLLAPFSNSVYCPTIEYQLKDSLLELRADALHRPKTGQQIQQAAFRYEYSFLLHGTMNELTSLFPTARAAVTKASSLLPIPGPNKNSQPLQPPKL
jgi:hypothetical protein